VNLSYLTLRRLTEELNTAVTGKVVKSASVLNAHDLLLRFEGPPGLLLSASPSLGRIALTRHEPQEEQDLPGWVEKYVVHSKIKTVKLLPYERVVELALSKRDRVGGKSSSRLISEVMGRNSNTILVSDPGNRVLGAFRRIGERVNRQRQILPGKPYVGPPPLHRPLPNEVTESQLEAALLTDPENPSDALGKSVAGMDRFVSAELLAQVGIRPGQPIQSDTLSELKKQLESLFSAPTYLNNPTIIRSGSRFVLCTLDFPGMESEVIEQFDSVSEAIECLATLEQREGSARSRKGEIERELRQVLVGIQRKVERIQSDIEDSNNADMYEKYGNILMANLHQIKLGMATITLPDIYDPSSQPVSIPLVVNRPPNENARSYLKRSRKARKGRPILLNRLEKANGEQAEIEALLVELERITEKELPGFQEGLIEKRLLRPGKKTAEGKRRKAEAGGIHPRRYRTSDGWSVLVGRNNAENDRLTAGAAREDIFLHAQGCPGSHVILKTGGRSDGPPRKTLEEAARLAAYWSKARNSKTVPVNYTEVRHVNKPRGATPGLVSIRNEKTLFVTPGEISKEKD
jgi:predicted ribosome quality control (RQC) complex YloA/Tae2 family protein